MQDLVAGLLAPQRQHLSIAGPLQDLLMASLLGYVDGWVCAAAAQTQKPVRVSL